MTAFPLPDAQEDPKILDRRARCRRIAPRDGGEGRPLLLRKSGRMAVWRKTVRAIETYLERVGHHPVGPAADTAGVRELLAGFDFDDPMEPLEALDRVLEGLWRHQTHASHPRCFGSFMPASSTAAIAAEALVAAFNPALDGPGQSPFAVEAERHLIGVFGDAFGYPTETAGGTFTQGAAEANQIALLSALVHAFPGFARGGLRALPGQPVLYVSSEGHPSVWTAARMSGLGDLAVRGLGVDAEGRADPDDLLERVARDRRQGLRPFLVVATAGTFSAGALDPLEKMAEVAAREDLWLHVDAAWGGAIALIPELRQLLAGIDRADSIAFDPHTGLSVPMAAGLYLTRRPEVLERAFEIAPDGSPTDATETDLEGPPRGPAPWSRPFAGLKVLLSLAVAGWDGYAAVLRNQILLGDALRRELERAGWEVVNRTRLPLACFVDRDAAAGRTSPYLAAVARHVAASGRAWISETRVNATTPALQASISSYRTTRDDVLVLVGCLAEARRHVSSRLEADSASRLEI